MKARDRLRMMWPPSVYIKLPNKLDEARDAKGRRYGDYLWLSLSLGHLHLDIFPKHTRRAWSSIWWRNGEVPPRP